jgi:tetratricopeptide (TPR) repeat protein
MTLRNLHWTRNGRIALYLGALLACLGLVGLRLGNALPINAWSLGYARLAMNGKPGLDALPLPPEGHQGASVWLAGEAVTSGDPERALDLLGEPDRDGAADVLSASVRADVLMAEGHFADAVESWVSAGDYQSITQAATQAQSQARLDDAELAYRGAWRLSPVDGTLPLANFLWQVKGDPAAAEALLRQSLTNRQAENLNWLRGLGNVLRAESRWDEALAYYERALQEKPDDLYTLRLIGEVYSLGMDQPEVARGYFQRMIDLAPEDAAGYFAVGQLMAKDEQFDEADLWFVRALSRNPDDPWMWVVRANTARSAGNVALALEIYEETVQRFPDYALAYYELAWAYRLNNEPRQAVGAIEGALARQQLPSPWFFVRAGEIYQWAGDGMGALKAYRLALSIDPKNTVAQQRVESLLK